MRWRGGGRQPAKVPPRRPGHLAVCVEQARGETRDGLVGVNSGRRRDQETQGHGLGRHVGGVREPRGGGVIATSALEVNERRCRPGPPRGGPVGCDVLLEPEAGEEDRVGGEVRDDGDGGPPVCLVSGKGGALGLERGPADGNAASTLLRLVSGEVGVPRSHKGGAAGGENGAALPRRITPERRPVGLERPAARDKGPAAPHLCLVARDLRASGRQDAPIANKGGAALLLRGIRAGHGAMERHRGFARARQGAASRGPAAA
mmetsp:Transcript_8372/g.28714  ORF Transcript_8372/g.28714 Transcript_8372/m.28714 type:complete len:261 (+) Transcript_8372:1634-2416(+)